MRMAGTVAAGVLVLVLLAGCSSDDDGDATGGDAEVATQDDAGADASGDQGADASDDQGGDASDDQGGDAAGDGEASGGGGGTLDLGGEAITFDSARCYLEEQDSAAGGGKILFTGQATGTNAAGDEVMIDVSRYDEDSMFAGDAVSVVVGDPFSADAASYSANEATDTITLDGSTLSAESVTLLADEDASEVPASFQIDC